MDTNSNALKVFIELQYDFRGFVIDDFLRNVGNKSGRQIVAMPWTMPRKIFGAWLSDDEEPREYIFYRDNVPVIHQVHIQLHEISHFLLRHPTLRINQKLIVEVLEGRTALPFGDLLKLRSPDQNPSEAEAEALADLIQRHVIENLNLAQLSQSTSERTLADFLKQIGGL